VLLSFFGIRKTPNDLVVVLSARQPAEHPKNPGNHFHPRWEIYSNDGAAHRALTPQNDLLS
jgi:hypothetical protein